MRPASRGPAQAALESLDVHEAEALVLTIPDEEAVLRALQTARRLAPELYIAVRTSFPTMGQRAAHLGADHVTVEEHAAANSLREALLERLGSELIGLQEISAELVNDEDWTEDEESATDVADRAELLPHRSLDGRPQGRDRPDHHRGDVSPLHVARGQVQHVGQPLDGDLEVRVVVG